MREMKLKLALLLLLYILLSVFTSVASELPPPPGPITTKQAMSARKKAERKHEKTIRLKVQDMDLGELLIALGSEMGWNVIVDKTISKKVSLDISHPIPISQAFEILLKLGGLKAIKLGDRTYLIVPEDRAKEFAKDEMRRVKLRYIKPSEAIAGLKGVKLTLIPDTKTNSVILYGKPEEIALAMKFIEMLDTPDAEVVTEVIKLNDASPKDVESTVSNLITAMGLKDVSVASDSRTNSVILVGPRKQVLKLKEAIDKLDRRLPQVLIAVDVIELFKSKDFALGIDFGGGTMTIISESPVLMGGGYGYIPTTTQEEGTTEESYFVKPPYDIHFRYRTPMQIQAIINFLYDRRHSKLLASPRVLTDDGKDAKVMVGDRIPIINQIMTTTQPGALTTTTAYQVQFVEVGVLLDLKPRTTEDGYVHLKIHPQVSTLKGFMEGFSGTKVPEIGTREVDLEVTVPDGEPIIIGGLIREEERKTKVRVPILGELPIIGPLFRSKSNEGEKSEIVFVIRPRIIDWRKIKRSENPLIYEGPLTKERLDGKLQEERPKSDDEG